MRTRKRFDLFISKTTWGLGVKLLIDRDQRNFEIVVNILCVKLSVDTYCEKGFTFWNGWKVN